VLNVKSLEMKESSKVVPLIMLEVIFSIPDYVDGLTA